MARFRRVDMNLAGPRALGILVPPGDPTLVIVRPRPLAWDLLPARWSGEPGQRPEFCLFARDEAAGVARRLAHLLDETPGACVLESFGDASARLQIWLRTDDFLWILCQRAPGQAYRPLVFSTPRAAADAAALLAPFLAPAADANQEYYFNTQKFK